MNEKSGWALRGKFYESCRTEGHCPLWFGRDMWEKPCVNFETYEIEEGQIGGVDMKGIIIIRHQDNIGPTFEELLKGPGEGAVYISSNATEEQRRVLEPFVKSHLGAEGWKKLLGVKFVDINIVTGFNGRHRVGGILFLREKGQSQRFDSVSGFLSYPSMPGEYIT